MSDTIVRDTQKVMEFVQDGQDALTKRISNLESISAAPQVLSRIITPVTVNNSVAETTLHLDGLPGNSLRTSNYIEIAALGRVANPSGGAVNFTWKLKYGTAVLTLGPFSIAGGSTVTGRLFHLYGLLKARNNNEQQQEFSAEIVIGSDYNVFSANGLYRGYTISNITQNSTIDQPVELTITHGTAGLTILTTLMLFKLGAPQVAA